MWEVVAAIVGVLLGALITWTASQKKPNHIEYREIGQYTFRLPAPAKIVFDGQILDILYLTRVALLNRCTQAIEQPQIRVGVSPDAKILNFDISVSPKRAMHRDTPELQREGNTTKFTLPVLFPHALNQEQVFIDIYSAQNLHDYEIFGEGLTKDMSGWAVKRADDWIRVPWLRYRLKNSRVAWLARIAWLGVVIGWACLTMYLIWQMATGLLNTTHLLTMLASPLFLVLSAIALSFTVLGLITSLILGFTDRCLEMPIPFLDRYLFAVIRRYDDDNPERTPT